MEAMTQPKPGLSDPDRATIAWRRYRMMMRWMALVAIAAVIAALAYLHVAGGLQSVHMVVATAAGVGLTVLLGSGLMLLAFLSSGTGHDEDVKNIAEDDR